MVVNASDNFSEYPYLGIIDISFCADTNDLKTLEEI